MIPLPAWMASVAGVIAIHIIVLRQRRQTYNVFITCLSPRTDHSELHATGLQYGLQYDCRA